LLRWFSNRRAKLTVEPVQKSQRRASFLALLSRQISTVEVKASNCERHATKSELA
jgi:hypothetical protein